MALQDTRGSNSTDAKSIAVKSHFNWGHAFAHQLKRISVDAEGTNQGLLGCVGEIVGQCGLCQAYEIAAGPPLAGATSASSFAGEIQADPPFLRDAAPVCAMETYSKYSPSVRA